MEKSLNSFLDDSLEFKEWKKDGLSEDDIKYIKDEYRKSDYFKEECESELLYILSIYKRD